jgi:hypothetical protein
MSTERRPTRYPFNHRGHCHWCDAAVVPPRRSWCSDACVHEWRIRADANYVRRLVLERDHGICAKCGLDTKKLKALETFAPDKTDSDFERERRPTLTDLLDRHLVSATVCVVRSDRGTDESRFSRWPSRGRRNRAATRGSRGCPPTHFPSARAFDDSHSSDDGADLRLSATRSEPRSCRRSAAAAESPDEAHPVPDDSLAVRFTRPVTHDRIPAMWPQSGNRHAHEAGLHHGPDPESGTGPHTASGSPCQSPSAFGLPSSTHGQPRARRGRRRPL